MYTRFLFRRGLKKNIINITSHVDDDVCTNESVPPTQKITNTKSGWFMKFLFWSFDIIIRFLKWCWRRPLKMIGTILTAIAIWLLSLFNIKLPSLPFLPIPTQSSKPQEEKKEDKKKEESKPSDQVKTNVVTTSVTNTITQTNIVTQTNYVNETKYITNFVVQPIVVTNTIFKEVPVVVTNVLVIKNGISDTNNSSAKNKVMNGPAFYFTDDFNTLLQNQQQNPVRGQVVN